MKKILAPRLSALAALLFEKPATQNYAVVAMLLLLTGASVAYTDTHIPTVVKHLVMILSLVGAARVFNTPALRIIWLSCVGFICFAVVLDVAVMFA